MECTIQQYEEHKTIYETQDAAYQEAQDNLPVQEALLVMDFTATRDNMSNACTGNEWWSHNTIHWLNVTVSRRTLGPQTEPSTSTPHSDWTPMVIDASSPYLHPCPYLKVPKGKTFLGAPVS